MTLVLGEVNGCGQCRAHHPVPQRHRWVHDKRLAEPYPLPAGSRLLQDLGFMAFTLPQVEILMPTKKPPSAELTPAQQTANQALHYRRLRIEHFNSGFNSCRVVSHRIRLWKQGVRDGRMEISG